MEHKIALLPGDGIGPEIIREAVRVLDAVAARFDHKFDCTRALVGAAAIDATGDPYPAETDRVCREADAILFGAIGDPRFDNDPTAKVRPEQGLLRMRRALGLFANLRPVQIFEALADRSPLKPEVVKGVDFVCVRELTGGIYFGDRGRDTDAGGNERAFDTCTYTRPEVDRIVRMAVRENRYSKSL
jgi:3-isopropylmalate dehydrogenase